MKVVMISSYPTEGCGISKYSKELINGLKNNKIEVFSYRMFFYKEKLKNIFWLKIFYEVLRIKPDFIHIQYTPTICGPIIPFFLVLLRIFSPKLKIILTTHEKPSTYLKYFNIVTMPFFILYEKCIYDFSDQILIHTSEHKYELIEKYKLRKEKLKIIPHGIDKELKVDITQLQEIKNKYSLENKDVITFFGSIRPNKGVEYLISSFSKVIKKKDNLILLIAGSAPKMWLEYFNELKCLVKELKIGGCVRFTGFVSDNDIPTILHISKIIVLPYIQSTQSGVLYREVISYTKPFIVSDVGGVGESVKKYNIGLIVPPKDVISLENAILEILNNYKKCNKYIENQKRVRKQYSWINIARIHVKIYRGEKYEHF